MAHICFQQLHAYKEEPDPYNLRDGDRAVLNSIYGTDLVDFLVNPSTVKFFLQQASLTAGSHEARLMRIAPVSQEMVCNYVAEHVLGLPRSY